jgi:hypothetical protein
MAATGKGAISRSDEFGLLKYTIDWQGHTDGVATLTFAAMNLGEVSGVLKYAETIPGVLGDKTTSTPTAAYDITITDAYAYDIMEGSLADQSATAALKSIPQNPVVLCNEALTVNISASGNALCGRLILVFGEV